METVLDLRRAICSLFEVHVEEDGTFRVVTPLEYPGSGDQIVVRVRPQADGFQVDESGDASLAATMAGGDLDSEVVLRWAEDLPLLSSVRFSDDVLKTAVGDELALAPAIFRIAEAAQQLHAISTARADRRFSDFKERLAEIVQQVVTELKLPYKADAELPIAGGLRADHVIGSDSPLLLFAANSPTRLLEAEVVYMQYRTEHRAGSVIAVVESQVAVGRKQFERAGYYTDRTVVWNPDALPQFVRGVAGTAH
jgi:hypothetical protein